MNMKKMLAVVAAAALVALAAPVFAANPFSDVPLNSWAYDAVMQLNARGILSGFPNGTFRGNQPMTRYELASTVARLLAVIEMDKASKEDVEILKRLVVEFKDELDALGVKTAGLDTRVSALEKGVGGWRIYGQMRFDVAALDSEDGDETSHNFNRYRVFFVKQLDANNSFTMRLGGATFGVERFFATMRDFAGTGVTMTVGKNYYDFQDEDGLHFGGPSGDTWADWHTIDGFHFRKSFGLLELSGYAGEHTNGTEDVYGARVKFNFNEKLWASANFVNKYGGTTYGTAGDNVSTYWAAIGFKFVPGIEVKGAYYKQDTDSAIYDDGSAYSVIVDIKQDFLKFTSVWAEYTKFDEDFAPRGGSAMYNPWLLTGGTYICDAIYANGAANEDTAIWNLVLQQKWNSKLGSFARYTKVDSDFVDGKVWTLGVNYYYTSAITFELAYEKNEMDMLNENILDDKVIRLRTYVNF